MGLIAQKIDRKSDVMRFFGMDKLRIRSGIHRYWKKCMNRLLRYQGKVIDLSEDSINLHPKKRYRGYEWVLLLIFILSSCHNDNALVIEDIRPSESSNIEVVPFTRTIHFTYKCHDYIKFISHYTSISIVHDPDCKCYDL